MTGFARSEGEHAGQRWIWEVKSVNGRGLDLKLRLPQGFDTLEPALRAAANAKFKRGSLQASLNLARDAAAAAALKIDFALVERLLQAGETFGDRVGKPSWDGLLSVRGVLAAEDGVEQSEEERAALEATLLSGFNDTLAKLAQARQAEGRALRAVFSDAADRMETLIAAARTSAAAAPTAALERIKQRLDSLSPEVKLDPARVAQEAAIAATRADVQEELERLSAHTLELRQLLTKPEPAGRRLDFLSQELTREANTLCSKSADLELTRIGLDLKTLVDQIKEQAANVE
ncbi:YicC/YloC family endoribonuclease [Vitreimonas flagellata]|uniref:YicC/YloC family endoribonuclease n=1 Tax=Vitreimonas flagellata TaxID=2560861 RepID=UPI0014318DB6|nr:YicC/YloC family endoribonuclease [Vitreimonas flagellata]